MKNWILGIALCLGVAARAEARRGAQGELELEVAALEADALVDGGLGADNGGHERGGEDDAAVVERVGVGGDGEGWVGVAAEDGAELDDLGAAELG